MEKIYILIGAVIAGYVLRGEMGALAGFLASFNYAWIFKYFYYVKNKTLLDITKALWSIVDFGLRALGFFMLGFGIWLVAIFTLSTYAYMNKKEVEKLSRKNKKRKSSSQGFFKDIGDQIDLKENNK
ncbi:MAG: hypothetical protein KU37_09635 [Sulfuricurvum sp. PC08-66]|nr:MAG: hypothetical protein KU37_09635 [Sulfuricurvum sp. PC08-66]